MDQGKDIDLKKKARQIRLSILEIVANSGSSHIAAAYSIVDILTELYFGILRIDPKKPKWEGRDRLLLSKGHGGAALYATLAHRGFFPIQELKEYAQNGSSMAGHIVKDSVPGMEITAGSLGHGLSLGVGMALALKINKSKSQVFVIVGDGECNEGSIWEAALIAPQFKLDNLILIIDRNRQQGMGESSGILNLEPFMEKWKAFNWNCLECDGHDFRQLNKVLSPENKILDKPTVVIANTQKGKGVSYMEKDPLTWHYKTPKDNLFEKARKELDA
jgi:transketolase